MKFHGFYGNLRIKEYLSHAVDKGEISHAFVLSGPKGIGKSTLAEIMARALVCTGSDRPCGECAACLKSSKQSHPDIIHLRRTEASIKVKEIRDIKQDAYLRPNDGERKVYVIHDADFMTQEAQDAFLKILEEPPAFTVFLLLCYNEKSLLETVRSRCVRLQLAPLEDGDMLSLLRERFPQESDARLKDYVSAACGIAGGVLDESDDEAYSAACRILSAVATGDALEIFERMLSVEKLKRDELIRVLDSLQECLRDALVCAVSGAGCMHFDMQDVYRTLCDRVTSSAIVGMSDAVRRSREFCGQNVGVAHITGYLACELSKAVRT